MIVLEFHFPNPDERVRAQFNADDDWLWQCEDEDLKVILDMVHEELPGPSTYLPSPEAEYLLQFDEQWEYGLYEIIVEPEVPDVESVPGRVY